MRNVEIDKISVNPFQPREAMEERHIDEMVSSIKRFGLLQPILVRKANEGYQIAAGERRYRAAVKAGMSEVPVIEKELSDREMLEIALIENIHREEMSPIDKANGFKRLMDEFKMTQGELAELFGISRPAVANTVRLLGLCEEARVALTRKEITEGHARAILGIKNNEAIKTLLNHIREKRMSVRECEEIVKKIGNIEKSAGNGGKKPEERTKMYEKMLTEIFKTKVRISEKSGIKKIVIDVYSSEDIERIIETARG